jgi:CspA family cold shock protein
MACETPGEKDSGAAAVPTGKVKWFDAAKGYGFILPDDGSNDVFVHITAVQKAGYTSLVAGVRVSYEIKADREGNPIAKSLKIGIGISQDARD